VNLKDILITSFNTFFKWRKAKLVKALIALRDKYLQSQTRVNQLEKENTLLKKGVENRNRAKAPETKQRIKSLTKRLQPQLNNVIYVAKI